MRHIGAISGGKMHPIEAECREAIDEAAAWTLVAGCAPDPIAADFTSEILCSVFALFLGAISTAMWVTYLRFDGPSIGGPIFFSIFFVLILSLAAIDLVWRCRCLCRINDFVRDLRARR